ncbi:MAG: hypothetical protein RLY83_437 [Actinomycetota bacterium]
MGTVPAPKSAEKDLLATLGGPIGILESLIPGTVYVTLFGFTLNVLLSAVVAGVTSLLFAVLQILRKRPLTQVIAGVVGLGISVYLPLRDGLSNTHAADYFVPGLLTNLGYAAAFGISILVRHPLAAIALSFLSENAKSWKSDKAVYRRFFWITIMWLAMFLVRLVIEVPLYLANQVAALGVAKLVLGTPFYALIIWFSWLMARVTLSKGK